MRGKVNYRGAGMATGFKRRVLRAGGWRVAKRLIKPIPFIGSLLAIGLAGHEIRKKGLLRGAVHVGLDVTPIVGGAKGLVELFTGDLIPDKEPENAAREKRLIQVVKKNRT
jgi:hypothetical protein